MTRTHKLDQILNGLLAIDVKRLNEETISKKITIEWLNDALDLECEVWEMKSLRNELIDKGLIDEINEELHITEQGKNYQTREKGFKQLDKVSNQEDMIRDLTIRKFKYDRIAFLLSIVAIIVSIIGIVMI